MLQMTSVMEEPLSVDTTSNFSSIAEAPNHLERQYAPLSEVFHGHSAELPQRGPADSNSEGECTNCSSACYLSSDFLLPKSFWATVDVFETTDLLLETTLSISFREYHKGSKTDHRESWGAINCA